MLLSRVRLYPLALGIGFLLGMLVRPFLRGKAPARVTVGGPFDGVNDRFHETYDVARRAAELDAPVFVVLADDLILFQRGERREVRFTPRLFHIIKSAAHAPVALFAAIHPTADGDLPPSVRASLLALQKRIQEYTARLALSSTNWTRPRW